VALFLVFCIHFVGFLAISVHPLAMPASLCTVTVVF
jgi:hypothetical protein